ncbi:restriction endonuclease subunit S [Streptococcus suis]|uniref:restriction endonuclease subunit S n=1 Tax=Streptococcus suis TaxID=1307 RepID=UPI001C95C9CE|nr:restriction endonuclease subunit S [Streptococcus suis]MBY4961401.1 restriction endonuclease subunit S [Streptococcus suis]MBY4967753.1 restriction endonuclease subunit S [Streptococcus suis]MBY4978829.1 restriction endonuclease subunit S [Streptococcus suis]MBY4987308.1 restriction endonuclease subunit S [Streptococcus suis]MBY4993995.1 restriction endonuclease subunit S [Streptococcus suis]
MTKEKSTVPRLRFPGFTDAWKQRKLGEVATFAKGNGYSKKDLVIKGSPIILYGRLYTKYETVISEVDTFVSVEDNKNSVVYSEGGEVLVPASGESSLDIARASVVAKKGIILGGDINIIRLHSEIFPVFLALTISNGKQQKGLSKRAQGKSVVHLHNSDLKKVDLDFPSLPEQEAIGSFFSDLDQLITLHQRKLDDVKELKKALLQKMFPKGNGNDFPELRFPEFTDAWKQRKLGEVAEKISQKNLDRQYVETFTNSAEFGIISQRDFFEKNISSLDNISGYYIVSPDDFVYNPRISNLAPVGPIKRNKLGRVGVMSPLYTIFRFSDIHLDFVEKYFDTTIWHRYMELNGDSGARSDRFAIKDSVFKGLPIPLPTLPEQEAIGSFFSDLDQLITLHQRQLDHLKLLKKALLQQMFI